MAKSELENAARRHAILMDRRRPTLRGYIAEARIFQAVKDQNLPVIRGVERSVHDGALSKYSFPELVQRAGGSSQTHFQQYISTASQSEVCTFEVKSIGLSYQPGSEILGYTRIAPSKYQKATPPDFYLIIMTGAPDWVALLPIEYMLAATLVDAFASNKMQHEDISPIYRPFVFRLNKLGVALERFQQCAAGKGPYIVPGSEITLHACKPKFGSAKTIVEPPVSRRDSGWQISLAAIERIRQPLMALGYDVLVTQPLHGDFEILGRRIEHKAGTQQYIMGRKGKKMIFYNPSGERTPFKASSCWEFLWIQHDKTAFLVPRDLFPSVLFTTTNVTEQDDYEKYRGYEFIMDEDDLWVDRVRSIIESHPTPMKPQPQRLAAPEDYPEELSEEEYEDVVEDLSDSDIELPEIELSAGGNTRGKVLNKPATSKVGQQHAAEAAERNKVESKSLDTAWVVRQILYDCARTGKGMLFLLSNRDTRGNAVFVDYGWTAEEQAAFWSSNRVPIQFHELLEFGGAHLGLFLWFQPLMVRASGHVTAANSQLVAQNGAGQKRFLVITASINPHAHHGSELFVDSPFVKTSFRMYPSEHLHFQDSQSIIGVRNNLKKWIFLYWSMQDLLGQRWEMDYILRQEHLHTTLMQWVTQNGNVPTASRVYDRLRFDNKPYLKPLQAIAQELADDIALGRPAK